MLPSILPSSALLFFKRIVNVLGGNHVLMTVAIRLTPWVMGAVEHSRVVVICLRRIFVLDFAIPWELGCCYSVVVVVVGIGRSAIIMS